MNTTWRCMVTVGVVGLLNWVGVAAARADQAKLAKEILANKDLTAVLERGRALLTTGLNAGSGYGEVWIRDLNTFIELALEVQDREQIRESLLIFFHFQGADSNIIDGYIPAEKANVAYEYILAATMPQLRGHKNTVETDQEASLVQAIAKYVRKTGDGSILRAKVNGLAVQDRLELALRFLLEHRYDATYGLIWGATTSDWGDVQPEHSWGVRLDESSHRAIDIYDNAMFVIAINDYLELLGAESSKAKEWRDIAAKIKSNTRKHLWDAGRHKFRPHVYLAGSPFPEDFDEERIYYHGGTAIAIEAGMLSKDEILLVLGDMVNNMRFAGAGSIGLTVYPPYPKGYFKNPSMVPFSYQNGGDWTWFGGRMIQQLIAHGYVEQAYRQLLPMIERVEANDGFFEWYTVANEPKGSGLFRGSAGVLGKAIEMLQAWARKQEQSS
ncbi:MAG: GH36-type glycosyl hydrolase domain-containing protein [Planctomycetota bacterium]